ncbi:hypothetical protein Vadar_005276 [Vaccinium darrowii]|uniref:Uncharacterized protein n=1 Tax=Vaccinium darrowii TaxID=229202 RepID=A0ACB7Z2G9_9ERIC|nr:hypothetical protein Vadar_005276 [Vaccinium darrowii]
MISLCSPLLTSLSLPSAAASSSSSSIYDVLGSHGLPTGILPKGITNFTIDPTTGRFEARLDEACEAKFETQVHYDWNISGTLGDFGEIRELSGVSAQDLFLWFPVTGIQPNCSVDESQWKGGESTQSASCGELIQGKLHNFGRGQDKQEKERKKNGREGKALLLRNSSVKLGARSLAVTSSVKRGMSNRGKRKDDDDFISDDDDAPPKKTCKKVSDDEDDIFVCEISKNRRVAVRNWQGKVVVDIREFYVKDGKQLPGKKGISLSMDQWNILKDHVDEIDDVVAGNN